MKEWRNQNQGHLLSFALVAQYARAVRYAQVAAKNTPLIGVTRPASRPVIYANYLAAMEWVVAH